MSYTGATLTQQSPTTQYTLSQNVLTGYALPPFRARTYDTGQTLSDLYIYGASQFGGTGSTYKAADVYIAGGLYSGETYVYIHNPVFTGTISGITSGSTVDLSAYYTSAQTDALLTNYYTSGQTDNILSQYSLTSHTHSEYLTGYTTDLSNYYVKSEVNTLTASTYNSAVSSAQTYTDSKFTNYTVGTNTQIIFNSGGTLTGSSNLTWNDTTRKLSITSNNSSGLDINNGNGYGAEIWLNDTLNSKIMYIGNYGARSVLQGAQQLRLKFSQIEIYPNNNNDLGASFNTDFSTQFYGGTNGGIIVKGAGSSGSYNALEVQSSTSSSVFTVKDNGTIVGVGLSVDVTSSYNIKVGYQAGSTMSGNKNVTIGNQAGNNIGSANQVVAIGYFTGVNAGESSIAIGSLAGAYATGGYNVNIGYQAGTGINGSSTYGGSVLIGPYAGQYLTTGFNYAVAIGFGAGINAIGGSAVSIGYYAGSKATGQGSISIGSLAGAYTTGGFNVNIGYDAGKGIDGSSTYGGSVFIGSYAGNNVTTGGVSVAIGYYAGGSIGGNSVAIGYYAGEASTGSQNVMIGSLSGRYTTGTNNVTLGYNAGYGVNGSSTYGGSVIVGESAGYLMTTGNYNTLIGKGSGYNVTTGSTNVFIGYNAGYNETTSDKLYISNSNTSTPLIYGDFTNNFIRIHNYLQLPYATTPSTSSANYGTIYSLSDGKIYYKNDSGVTFDLTASGGTGGSTPGGTNGSIQFNSGGTLSGTSNLTWDNNNLTIKSANPAILNINLNGAYIKEDYAGGGGNENGALSIKSPSGMSFATYGSNGWGYNYTWTSSNYFPVLALKYGTGTTPRAYLRLYDNNGGSGNVQYQMYDNFWWRGYISGYQAWGTGTSTGLQLMTLWNTGLTVNGDIIGNNFKSNGYIRIAMTNDTTDGNIRLNTTPTTPIPEIRYGSQWRKMSKDDPFTTLSITVATSSITWNYQDSCNAYVQLTQNVTGFTITNDFDGASGYMIVQQDATGGRTLQLPANSKVFGGGLGQITLTTSPSSIDVLSWKRYGSSYYWTAGYNMT